jgi:hypothetical protein
MNRTYPNSDEQKEFIKKLEKLTRETGIAVGGCGCCGSPWITTVDITSDESGYGYADEIRWIDPSDDYAWENYKDTIVKE